MHIHIQARGFGLTPGLREYTERRLWFAFGPGHPRVGRIAVCLSDDNGPRGGEDKRCHVRVSVRGASGIVIEETERDLYTAIARAVDRAARTVARRLERLRDERRLPLAIADSGPAR